MFLLIFLRQQLWMLGENEGYGLQKIARLTISLNSMPSRGAEYWARGTTAQIPQDIKNSIIMHDYTSATYKTSGKSLWETTLNSSQSVLAITKFSLDYPLCNRMQQLQHYVSRIVMIHNLFSYSTASKLAAWLHKHVTLQGLFDQLCLQAIKLHRCS